VDDTELAVIDYLPGSWSTDKVVCIARRTRIPGRPHPDRTGPQAPHKQDHSRVATLHESLLADPGLT